MSELKPCPTDREKAIAWFDGLLLSEHMMNEEAVSAVKEALKSLRRTQPDNAPLTIDELRGMDGEPVWVVFDDDSTMCALVDAGNVADNLKLTGNWGEQIVLAEHRSHIKAIYHRKPEPEGGAL